MTITVTAADPSSPPSSTQAPTDAPPAPATGGGQLANTGVPVADLLRVSGLALLLGLGLILLTRFGVTASGAGIATPTDAVGRSKRCTCAE